jgi:hypothetical protein
VHEGAALQAGQAPQSSGQLVQLSVALQRLSPQVTVVGPQAQAANCPPLQVCVEALPAGQVQGRVVPSLHAMPGGGLGARLGAAPQPITSARETIARSR